MIPDVRTVLTIADARDREQIYRIRHHVYATELAQHPENPAGELIDTLDAINVYLVAKRSETVLGFAAVTPPGALGYSLDKYFPRAEVPLTFDEALYEVRLLTVIHPARRSDLAGLLMYGAFRYCESRGARQIAAIGRLEVLDVYCRAGLQPLGRRVQAGAVTYELMTGDVRDLRRNLDQFAGVVLRRDLAESLADLGWDVVPGCANFLLCHLPSDGPSAATVAANARAHGLFLREVGNLGSALGEHALRVAVKDRGTNDRMHTILMRVLARTRHRSTTHASTSDSARVS